MAVPSNENVPLLRATSFDLRTYTARRARSFSDAEFRRIVISSTSTPPRPPRLPPARVQIEPPIPPPPPPPRCRVSIIDYSAEKCVEHGPIASYARAPKLMSSFSRLIHVERADQYELAALADLIPMPELSTLQSTNELVPRVEVYDETRIVVAVDAPLHGAAPYEASSMMDNVNETNLNTEFVPVVLMADCRRNILVIVHTGDPQGTTELRTRLATVLARNIDDVRRHGVVHLLCVTVTVLVDRFYPLLECGDVLDEVESVLLGDGELGAQKDVVRVIAQTKRAMLNVRRRLWPFRRCLARLSLVPLNGAEAASDRFYTRALLDHVVHLLDVLDMQRESAHALLDIYLNAQNNRMQEIMQKIAVVTTIFVPLSFLTSVEGMNFSYMPELNSKLSYPLFLLVVAAIVITMTVWFRRRGWL